MAVPHFDAKAEVSKHLAASGIQGTTLLTTMFFDNLLSGFLNRGPDGSLVLPSPTARQGPRPPLGLVLRCPLLLPPHPCPVHLFFRFYFINIFLRVAAIDKL